MSKAANKVIAGDYRGKRVLSWRGKAFISLSPSETLDLSPETVASCTLLDTDHDISLPSAATRAYIGQLLFGPAGLSAAGTAERNEINHIAIEFKDGKSCVLKVDDVLREMIV